MTPLFVYSPSNCQSFLFLLAYKDGRLTVPAVEFLFLSTEICNTGNGMFSTHPVLSSQAALLSSVYPKKGQVAET